MDILMVLFTAFLSFILSPGIFFTLPVGGSKIMIALTHAIVFAILYELVEKSAERIAARLERFTNYSASTFAGQRREFPNSPIIKNGEICMADTCVCNQDQIGFYERCQ
jgi:hypothetical protein